MTSLAAFLFPLMVWRLCCVAVQRLIDLASRRSVRPFPFSSCPPRQSSPGSAGREGECIYSMPWWVLLVVLPFAFVLRWLWDFRKG